jgi:hypothetical protein
MHETTNMKKKKSGKVVRPTSRPHLPHPTPRKHSCYSFLLETERSQGHSEAERLCQSKIPMTPSGIEPATSQLVAQCLTHRIPHE